LEITTELQIHTHVFQNTADILKNKTKSNIDRRPNRISKQILKYQRKEKDIWDKKMIEGLFVTYT
jgi:hypothetical protein